jgi:hypothetical protein
MAQGVECSQGRLPHPGLTPRRLAIPRAVGKQVKAPHQPEADGRANSNPYAIEGQQSTTATPDPGGVALAKSIIYCSAAMTAATLRKLVIPAAIAGIALIVIAIIYFTQPEHSLPSFFPGHSSASAREAGHHHVTHGIAALIVGLACFAFAWFQSGPKTKSA